jgi:C1A family cysteine protease
MLRYVMSAIRRKHAATITLLFVLIVASAQAVLPTAFDWRNQGYTLPPVRNQLSCGSCWAVCAIDIMETKIIMQLGKTVDLSEQWLVSCTQGGDGCGGGVLSYALESLKCSRSTQADSCGHSGAVLEADFPYTATNATCHCPYNHPYCIDSWSSVGTSHPPTNDQLKQAIYDHGPVACYMDVYTDLYSYSSGVYVHTTGGTPVGIKTMVLIGWGWDGLTAQEYWIVKNTWGPTWGISGYCKVAFGTCNIGDWAAYVGSVSEISIPHFCGEIGQVYLPLDLDKDCYVGLGDLAIFAANWLKCTDLSDPACSWD